MPTCPSCKHTWRSAKAGLTAREAQALDILRAREQSGNVGMTYQELAAALGNKSKSGAWRLVESLREKGWVTHPAYKSRAIRVGE